MHRRNFLRAGTASMALAYPGVNSLFAQPPVTTGRLKQSVARWCFGSIPIETLCAELQDMGVTGMDLVGPAEWDTCFSYGITPCMVQGAGTFTPAPADSGRRFGPSFGWNKIENHASLIAIAETNINLASAAGVPGIIGLFGDREGMSDEQGIENCVIGLKQIVPMLEAGNVTIGIEVLNSLVDHLDYQGDNTAYGVEVCKRVSSERVKLVYDAYHMQIMEGNLISTIRENIDYISHFHVAGVPGRNEIDETQEVNWTAVATAIANLGFTGYVAHEWIPTGTEPLEELRKAVALLTV